MVTHLAQRLELPDGYTARPYAGASDHRAMTDVLASYREHVGDPEMPTVEQLDVTYGHLHRSDAASDIAIVELDGTMVGYSRTEVEDLGTGVRDLVLFSPTRPEHLGEDLFVALVAGQEAHLSTVIVDPDVERRFRSYAAHPSPGARPTVEAGFAEAAWLESLGYVATEWGATLLRADLEDIPDLALPDGVEVRPVEPEQVRPIVEAHFEAFRGEWDFIEPTVADIDEAIDDPLADPSLWKVAWAGDQVVGQVKPFINEAENAERGYRRGYTEYISTHRDWRNRGIAGALLAMSLRELRDRGMAEAALGVDTNNPGGALQLYTSLGFELRSYEAVYTRPITPGV